MTKYRPLLTVTTGIKAQLEADLNALDQHEKLPKQADDLGKILAEAYGLCEEIIKLAEAEPEPTE